MEELKEFIANSYGLPVDSVVPMQGGFYGKVFSVEARGMRYAAKLDMWKTHKREFRESLVFYELLAERGLSFVPGLIHGKNGERSFDYGGGVLALFEFAEGEHTEDIPKDALFERLGRVYARCKGDNTPQEALFSMEMYERVTALKARLESVGGLCGGIAALIDDNRPMIEERRRKMEIFMERCRGKRFPVVLTHGDAGGNCILGSGGISLIDWDTARYSVPERDAWAHMTTAEDIALIEKGLAGGGFPYRLDADAFGYFANAWFFEYLGNYMQCAADAPEDMLQGLYEGIKDYFGCWIFEVLACADRQI